MTASAEQVLHFESAYSGPEVTLNVKLDDPARSDLAPAALLMTAEHDEQASIALSADDADTLRAALAAWVPQVRAHGSSNLPDGWIRLLEVGVTALGPGYYRAQDAERRIPNVYWVPSLTQPGEGWIEVGSDSMSVAEAELLGQRITEAVALAKAGAR